MAEKNARGGGRGKGHGMGSKRGHGMLNERGGANKKKGDTKHGNQKSNEERIGEEES
jgi:hypothetical protein